MTSYWGLAMAGICYSMEIGKPVHQEVCFFSPSDSQFTKTVAYTYLAFPIRPWMSLALKMGHRHPLIPTGPHTCLLYSRLQTTLESTGQRARGRKHQRRQQKWAREMQRSRFGEAAGQQLAREGKIKEGDGLDGSEGLVTGWEGFINRSLNREWNSGWERIPCDFGSLQEECFFNSILLDEDLKQKLRQWNNWSNAINTILKNRRQGK